MNARITTCRTLGFAAALMAVALTTSAAQQTTRRTTKTRHSTVRCKTMTDSTMRDSTMIDSTRRTNCLRSSSVSTTRIPLAKERPAASGTLDTTVMAPPTAPPAAVVETTTTVVTPVPVDTTTVITPPPAETTIVVPPPMAVRHYGNGFYFGVGGGASMPTGGTSDAYKTGYNITVPFGWDAPLGPLGIRADIGYDQFQARSVFKTAGAGTAAALTNINPQVWSANADAKFRFPFVGRFLGGATTGLYALGGVGTSYFRNYDRTFAVTNPNTNSNSTTTTTLYGDSAVVTTVPSSSYGSLWRFDANVGGGLSLAFGNTELFVESRYIRAFTSPQRLNWVPIILGVTFR